MHLVDVPAVTVDACALWRVLHELLSNAITYRSVERPLRILVRSGRRGPVVHIAIEDNGRGAAG